MADSNSHLVEIEALKADIIRRRNRRQDTLDRVAHLMETIETLAVTMRRVGINATIEAARAGDAGAPFAVVASEIKGLASAMRKATEEVGALLKDRETD